MHNSSKIKEDISTFLKANAIMTLATSDRNRPWVCTLHYGIDDGMNLYVVTDPNSRHGKIIMKNPKTAFNIFDSHQKITEPKKGLQGQGEIKLLKGMTAAKGLLLWHRANPGIETKITVKDIRKKITDAKIYRIKPTYLKFFNKELYGKKEYGILELKQQGPAQHPIANKP